MTIHELVAWFLLGVSFHVLYKWMGWRGSEPGRKLLDYWAEHGPLVVQGILLDGLVFVGYWLGALDSTIQNFAAVVGYVAVSPSTVITLARAMGVDPSTIDPGQLAALVTTPLEIHQPIVAVVIGGLADSILKSFMPGILRAARAVARTATDKMAGGNPPPAEGTT
jgi:hypothetical protein